MDDITDIILQFLFEMRYKPINTKKNNLIFVIFRRKSTQLGSNAHLELPVDMFGDVLSNKCSFLRKYNQFNINPLFLKI